MRRPLTFAIIVMLGIGVDLLTKMLVFGALTPEQIYIVVPNVLILVHAENRGVAFSLFAGHPWFILIVTALAILFLIGLYTKTRDRAHGFALAAIALLLIGAIGNIADRLYFGFVRDFIDFVPRIPLIGHWAVFNVADICITVGVFIYAICELFLVRPVVAAAQEP